MFSFNIKEAMSSRNIIITAWVMIQYMNIIEIDVKPCKLLMIYCIWACDKLRGYVAEISTDHVIGNKKVIHLI